MYICHTVISPELVMEVEARMKRNYLPPSMQPKQQPQTQMINQYQNTSQIPMQQLQNNFQQLQFANQTPMLQYQQNNTQNNQSNNGLLSFPSTNAMSVNNTMLNANNVGVANSLPSVPAGNVQSSLQRKYSSHGPHRCKLQTLATVQELGKSIYFFSFSIVLFINKLPFCIPIFISSDK